MERFLDPKNDYVFHRLFGTEKNKAILIEFLNAVFKGHEKPIEDLTFLQPHQQVEIAVLRESIVDVLCRDQDGTHFIVEMQCYWDRAFLKRACFYACRAYINQKVKGIDYADLKPIRFLAILKESIFPKKESYLSRHEYHDVFTHERDINEFVFTFLELGKIDKTIEESKTIIEKWVYFFKYASDTTNEELMRLTQEYPVISDAYQALSKFNYSVAEMDEYYRYDMKVDEINNRIDAGRAEGLVEGKAEGLAEGKAEGLAEGEAKGKAEGLSEGEAKATRNLALELLRQGVDKNIIATATKLSLEELEHLITEPR
jgi:predicted transposase/invertase (TIGR01784 family)